MVQCHVVQGSPVIAVCTPNTVHCVKSLFLKNVSTGQIFSDDLFCGKQGASPGHTDA